MAFSNVNIGSYPDDGTGDPLRVAFNVINNNFANITNGSVTVNAPVKSVAGRTGNVTLTITDISGAASYAYVAAGVTSANAYTDSQIAIVNANIATLSANLTASITANVIANINLAGTNANIAAANVAIAQLQANDVSQNSSISSLNSSVVTIQNSNNANSANITLLQSGATATNSAIVTANTAMKSYVDANAISQLSQITGANAAIVTANTAMKSYVDTQDSAITSAWQANTGGIYNTVTGITANVLAINVTVATHTTNISSLQSNSVTQFTWLNNLTVTTGATTNSVVSLQNNQSNDEANIATLQSGIIATNSAIVTANTAMKNYVDANAVAQLSRINGSNAAIVTANTAMQGYVDAVTTAWTANAATQSILINTINANIVAINLAVATHTTNISSLQSNSVTQFTWLNNLTASVNSISTTLTTEQNTLSAVVANVTTGYINIAGNITGGNLISTHNVVTTGNVIASEFYYTNGSPVSAVTGDIAFVNSNMQSISSNTITINDNFNVSGNIYAGLSSSIHNFVGNVVFGPATNLVESADSIITIIPGGNVPSASNNSVHLQSFDGKNSIFGADTYATGVNYYSSMVLRRARGTSNSPTALVSGDIIASVSAKGYGDTGFTNTAPANMVFQAAENLTDTANGTNILFNIVKTNTTVQITSLKLDASGNVVVPATTISANISTGALVVKGGVGIAGNLNIGGNIISNSYLFANGVSIFTTIAGSIGTYSNTNAAAYLSSNTVTTINTTGNITTSGNLVTNFITTAAGSGANLIIDPDGNADVIINAANVWLNAGHLRSTASTFLLANIYPTTAYMFGNATAIYMGAGAVNLSVGNGSGNITVGNVLTNNHLYANGVSILTGVTYNYSNSNVSSYLTVNPQSGTYSNSNVSSYLTVNPQSGTYSNANIVANLANYVTNIVSTANITAGNLLGTHYGNVIGATATHTGNVTINGFVSMTGNLGVDGGQVTMYDSILDLHTYANTAAWASDDGKDIGLRMHYFNGVDSLAFLGLENSTRSLQFLINATETNSNVTGTFGNAQLGSLFLSNTTVSTGATPTTSGALYVAGGAGIAGNLAVAGNLNVTANTYHTGTTTTIGNVYQQGSYYETYSNVSNTGGNLTLNFVNGAIYYATLTTNVTVNVTNISNTAFTTTGFTVIIDQGSTPYRIANIQFAGGTVSNIKWAGATVPTGTASNTDVISISLINLNNGLYRILGQQSSYA